MVIFSSYMKNIIFLVLVLSAFSVRADDSVAVVEADFWVSPRYGESVVRYEPLALLMRRLVAEPEARLLVSVPEGEWGELWGQELQAWLVSLGLERSRIDFDHVEDGRTAELVSVSLLLPKPLARDDGAAPAPAPVVPIQKGTSSTGEIEAEVAAEEVAGQSAPPSDIAAQDEIVVQEQE